MRILLLVLVVVEAARSLEVVAARKSEDAEVVETTTGTAVINNADDLDKDQEGPMSCVLNFTPRCLRVAVAGLVERMPSEAHFQLLPGVMVSSDHSRTSSGSDPLGSIMGLKTATFFRSLTLSVRPLDMELPFLNTSRLLDKALSQVTGRRKGGDGAGLGAVALMMGGTMMTMMMAGLAAMAGKALMTSLTALMLAAMGAMKSHGGGGGGETTYEVITPHHHGHS